MPKPKKIKAPKVLSAAEAAKRLDWDPDPEDLQFLAESGALQVMMGDDYYVPPYDAGFWDR